MKTSEMSKDMSSVMLYMETCLVDHDGRLESLRMNEADFEAMDELKEKGFINYGRLPSQAMEMMRPYGRKYTHWVKFTTKAWALAHRLRKERAQRTIKKMLEQYGMDKDYSLK